MKNLLVPMMTMGLLACDESAPGICTDRDDDGVCNIEDLCEGDDALGDADGDGICGACEDRDGDGVCNAVDLCEGDDALGDADADGICGECADRDGDGVCNVDDQCEGDDALGDDDADGICGVCDDRDLDGICNVDDLCEGDDGLGDADADGVCGVCEDRDGDGICNTVDRCEGNDASGDTDNDGFCGDIDFCDGDDLTGDVDLDGICEDQDTCMGASGVDADGDGLCDDVDACDDRANPNGEAICNVWFVDSNAAGAGTGATWADAFTHPRDALAMAASGDEVWVAEGTYRPDSAAAAVLLTIPDGVRLRGGFMGDETSLQERAGDFLATVLTGDFDGDDDVMDPTNTMTDNANRLLSVGWGSVIDGFHLTAAYTQSPVPAAVLDAPFPTELRNAFVTDIFGNGLAETMVRVNIGALPGELLVADVAFVGGDTIPLRGWGGTMTVQNVTAIETLGGIDNFGSGEVTVSYSSILSRTSQVIVNNGGRMRVYNSALWSDGGGIAGHGHWVMLNSCFAGDDSALVGGVVVDDSVRLDGSSAELGNPFIVDFERLYLARAETDGFTSACVGLGDRLLTPPLPGVRSTATNGTPARFFLDAGASYLVP